LLPTDLTKFFRYPGSLTTPGCFESVTWTVFKDVVNISQYQVRTVFLELWTRNIHRVYSRYLGS